MSFEKVEDTPAIEAVVVPEKKIKFKSPLMQSVMASLKSFPVEKQLSTLLSKYEEIAEENQKLLSTSKTSDKSLKILRTEKKKLEQENSKYILAKSRLESLGRELQKQNKLIKEENTRLLKEEEHKRKNVSDQLQKTLAEISKLMDENSQRNNKLKVDNHAMSGRLQDLVKQHEDREERVEKALEQKQLLVKLSETRLAKMQIEFNGEKETLLREKKGLLLELSAYQKKIDQFSDTELGLRNQLSSYSKKYEQFQGTLDKSNQVFKTFKSEMDEMANTASHHEKESRIWRQKCESANKSLLQMVNERTQMESKITIQDKQLGKLQNVCRALQHHNSELRAEAKIADLALEKMSENKENCESASLNNEPLPSCDSVIDDMGTVD